MTASVRWRDIGRVETADVVDAARELCWALEVVASTGHTFADARDDGAHAATRWDVVQRSLVGAPFARGYPFRLALRPEDLTLVLLDRTGEALGSLPLGGATSEAAYEWLGIGLATYMGGPPPPITPCAYAAPTHRVGRGAPFSTTNGRAREEVARLYALAAAMLEDLVSTRHDHGPILCGPGHCRLATRLTIAEEGERVGARTVEVGFAGSGGGASSWHWYVTLSPSPSVEALPPLPCPGGWRVGAWVGAVLDAPEILSAEPAFREPMVRKFLDIAVDTASNLPLRPAAEPASGSQ